jgi:RNA polymerase sigma-70 factor (ECF subfamily)
MPVTGRREKPSSSDFSLRAARRDGAKTPQSPRSPEREAQDQRVHDLVEAFRDGDESAFDELAPLVMRMAYHIALKSVADPNEADELAHLATIRVYQHVKRIEGVGAFKTWFYRVVLNLVHDHYRRASRKDNAHGTLEEIRTIEKKAKEQPLNGMELDHLRGSLREAIASLDEKHREVFILKEINGLGHAEIADMLNVPTGTVWSRLSYARKKLQEKLTRQGYSNA